MWIGCVEPSPGWRWTGGQSLVEAARQAGLDSGSTVTGLVQRFNERVLAALSIAAGRGHTPTYDRDARATVVTVAQQDPERRRDGSIMCSRRLSEYT